MSIFSVEGSDSLSFQQQVVLVMDGHQKIHQIGQLLYQEHDTSSYVLVWSEVLQLLQPAQWNANIKKFQVCDMCQTLPIGPGKPFTWLETVVRVVGIDNVTTVSGFSAKDLASITTSELADGDIGQIDIITTEPSDNAMFLELFMDQLRNNQKYHAIVTFQSAIMAVDHSGSELRGQLKLGINQSSIEWKHAAPSQIWEGSFTGDQYQIQHLEISARYYSLKSPYFGILPSETEVFVTDFQLQSNRPTSYAITDEYAFEWLNKSAQMTYSNIPAGRGLAVNSEVLLLPEAQDIKNLPVIEIRNVTDLLKELHYYGEKGPSDHNDTEVYYRFGNWIITMNEGTFHVKVGGIIALAVNSSHGRAQLEAILAQWQIGQDLCPAIQLRTDSHFFDDVIAWINGLNSAIDMNMESLFNAQCGITMFLSEAIHSFQAHLTNMMSLDLARYNYLSIKYFFSSHPMASRITGKAGLDLLQAGMGRISLQGNVTGKILDEVIQRMAAITKSWFSHIDKTTIKGSRDRPPASILTNDTIILNSILSRFERIGSLPPFSGNNLRVFELHESLDKLLSTNLSAPEIGVIGTNIIDFSSIDAETLPVQASIALLNDHAYVSEVLLNELHAKELQTGKKYLIVPNSVEVDEESDVVKFFVQEVSQSYSEIEQLTTNLVKSHLQSKALLEKIMSLSNKTKPIDDVLKKGDKLVKAVMGIANSINQLESGNLINILKGAFSLGKNLKTIGDITGVSKAAEEFLGKALKPSSEKAAKSVIGEVGDIVKSTKDEVKSLIGKFNKLKEEFSPVIKALYGIYDIYQDFKKHTTLGYIDGAFDIATTVLSLLGPDAAPLEAALSVIKMGVDYFYADISKELHALPPHASVGQIVVAVLKGILDGVINIIQDIIHNLNPFAVIGDVHKLNDQYNTDRQLLEKMSDYRNYYNILKDNGSDPSEINFAGGSAAWNGGDIEFHLGEDGHSILSLQAVTADGNQIHETHDLDTQGVEDIILGIGESHSISFKKITIHFAWFIPVDSKTVISKVSGEKDTLHGTYYGNSHNNKFIAVQELPPKTVNQLGYNLYDYHYTLYGGGGNDTFYLGPQPTYVEGNEGSDAYFINSTSTFTAINSHAGDGQDDTMIINLDYSQLTARKAGFHLNLTSSNTHRIVILNWFLDVTHQRMIFKTGDGVLFKVSATITEEVDMIAYALSGSSSTIPVVYDSRLPIYSEVVTIVGSEYDDTLYGNDLDNQLNGAGGNDRMTGANGKDTYTIDFGKGVDTIDNFATDGAADSLVIRANLDELLFSSHDESNHLYISHDNVTGNEDFENSNTGAVIVNWFLNETYRHLVVVTEDKALIKVSSIKNATVAYQSLIINMSDIEPNVTYGDPYTRKLDLNSNQDYAQVLTVFGTSDNDSIIGNLRDNYITGGQGFDYLEGREGADTYVVKENDGSKIIMNCATDTDIDTLLFAAKFDDIDSQNISESDAMLSGNNVEVTLKNWFHGRRCQHMVIRSADGVTFGLPNDTTKFEKIAKAVDNSNLTSDVQLILSGKWANIQRVVGSQGDDQILGNSLDNYLDPGKGNSYLQGGNGSDTYVIRSTYGEDNIINNYAEDELTDTILFMVPFLSIQVEVSGMDIRLTSLSGDGLVGIKIVDYNFQLLKQARHLLITTSDGISFVLPVAVNGTSKLTPVSINTAQVIVGQHIHLAAHPDFSEVRSVFGSSRYQNTLIGNRHNNTMVGGASRDLLQGGDGNDVLKGGSGDDVIDGGSGVDTLLGEDGDDVLRGNEGDDIISPGSGSNQVDGGEGIDTVIYNGVVSQESGIELDLITGICIHDGGFQDQIVNIENAYGTEYDDVLQGDDKDNVLIGQGGNDYLSPGSGYDMLSGGNGNDTYNITSVGGTVTVENYAPDMALDLVIIGYANMSQIWYEIKQQDVIIRAINTLYPIFYDGNKPAVVFKKFMSNSSYQHISIETADGSNVLLTEFINPKNSPSNNPTTDSIATRKPNGLSGKVGSSSLYVALALLLVALCFFSSILVIGIYRNRSKCQPRRYNQLLSSQG